MSKLFNSYAAVSTDTATKCDASNM